MTWQVVTDTGWNTGNSDLT